jgi:hypothetical protein
MRLRPRAALRGGRAPREAAAPDSAEGRCQGCNKPRVLCRVTPPDAAVIARSAGRTDARGRRRAQYRRHPPVWMPPPRVPMRRDESGAAEPADRGGTSPGARHPVTAPRPPDAGEAHSSATRPRGRRRPLLTEDASMMMIPGSLGRGSCGGCEGILHGAPQPCPERRPPRRGGAGGRRLRPAQRAGGESGRMPRRFPAGISEPSPLRRRRCLSRPFRAGHASGRSGGAAGRQREMTAGPRQACLERPRSMPCMPGRSQGQGWQDAPSGGAGLPAPVSIVKETAWPSGNRS